MDKDIHDAIRLHRQRFGEFNVTILGLNMEDPGTKQMLLDAISKSLDNGKPVSDEDIGLNLSEGDLV
jgi:hypothetical protein